MRDERTDAIQDNRTNSRTDSREEDYVQQLPLRNRRKRNFDPRMFLMLGTGSEAEGQIPWTDCVTEQADTAR